MKPPIGMLLIFVNETDRWQDAPLFKALVQRLWHAGIAGATVHAGIMGFGRHHRVHHKGLFGVSDDRPITISAVDEESKLRAVAADLAPMVKEGLMVLVDAELLHTSH
jgi:PII-like signaling protein